MSSPTAVERMHRSAAGPLARALMSRLGEPGWRRRGSPPPAPPHRKIAIVRDHVRRLRPSAFVETGTYRGDTLAAIAPLVPRAVSIELDARLATLARARFVDEVTVTILQGDSADLLPAVVAELTEPALFWLDGHFSGGLTAGEGSCPILAEVRTVLSAEPAHAVLIDDARLFDGSAGYPTLGELRQAIGELRPGVDWELKDDIIRLLS